MRFMTFSMNWREGRGRGAYEGGIGVVYEDLDTNDGLWYRNKIVFISWSPDEGTLVFVRGDLFLFFPPLSGHASIDYWINRQPRMTYASSKEALKNALNGLGAEVQANNEDEIEYSTILKDISKGKR